MQEYGNTLTSIQQRPKAALDLVRMIMYIPYRSVKIIDRSCLDRDPYGAYQDSSGQGDLGRSPLSLSDTTTEIINAVNAPQGSNPLQEVSRHGLQRVRSMETIYGTRLHVRNSEWQCLLNSI